MTGRNEGPACSADLRQVLDEVNLNYGLDFSEFQVLHDAADERLDALVRRYGNRRESQSLQQFQLACDQMAKMLQVSCLAMQRAHLNEQERYQVREAYEFQVAYIQACLQRSFEGF
ncbi:hypothetical protein ACIP1T_24075 [Pseudomonas japonica]|uniref:hypothetical protein n=1 Tax=Pseudomonas TaxID=286 RepID=UPI002928C7A4|nr:hypothetical protein [Pseudomonas sp. zfem002]MDU9389400.1 hypothetical protein [Pseudomonas sp. zfem002]